jgi:hypothetical protein
MSSTTLIKTTPNQPTSIRVESQPKESLIDGLWVIPAFDDKHAERQWAKEHMAAAFRVFAKLGYADGAGGHISLRDPVRTDCFWISEFYVLRWLNSFELLVQIHTPSTSVS